MNAEQQTPSTEVTATETITKAPGRPANPESARQKRLADLEARKAAGALRLGRPVKADSKRQQELAAKAERQAQGGAAQKGRPKMTEEQKAEARAKREAEQAAAKPVEVVGEITPVNDVVELDLNLDLIAIEATIETPPVVDEAPVEESQDETPIVVTDEAPKKSKKNKAKSPVVETTEA